MEKVNLNKKSDDYEIVTYKDLFDYAEDRMFSLKSDEIEHLINFIETDCCYKLGIELEYSFMNNFLDLCAGKSTYIDNCIEEEINYLETEEQEIMIELEEAKKNK